MTRIFAAAVLLVLAGLSQPAPGQPAAQPRESRIVRLDAAVDAIVPAGVVIEKVAEGFEFTEEPVWSRDGALLFSDSPANIIYRLDAGDRPSVFRQPAGFDGQPDRPGQHIGSNGLTLDRQGRLIVAEHGNRRVSRIDANGDLTVLADRYEGKRFNSPNDVAVRSDGSIYFTDPPYGLPRQDDDPAKELDYSGIFRIRDGRVELLSRELSRPNGIGFSPDERFLYVANSEPDRRIWMRFPVQPDGTLGAGTVFVDATADEARGIPDGLAVDESGNLYATGPGGVWIISPDARLLGRVEPPETARQRRLGRRRQDLVHDGAPLHLPDSAQRDGAAALLLGGRYVLVKPFRSFLIVNVPSRPAETLIQ